MDTKTRRLKIKTMKTTNMLTMKSLYILAAILGVQFNTTFAAVNFTELPGLSNKTEIVVNSQLTPVTPDEATFEDAAEMSEPTFKISDLAPVLPIVADFNDGAPTAEISMLNLAPVTPKEADFEDVTGIKSNTSIQDLAPVTPVTADFEDHI
jgi:hypothetical protein